MNERDAIKLSVYLLRSAESKMNDEAIRVINKTDKKAGRIRLILLI